MSNTHTSFSAQTSTLLNNIHAAIRPLLSGGKFQADINYQACSVEILNDDGATILVKWGSYYCNFDDLPVRAMATIADTIVSTL